MKDFQISYIHCIVADTDIGPLAEIMSRATDNEDNPVNFTVCQAPDIEKNKILSTLREEFKETLIKESQQYSNYWLRERAESAKLRERVKELEGERKANESL